MEIYNCHNVVDWLPKIFYEKKKKRIMGKMAVYEKCTDYSKKKDVYERRWGKYLAFIEDAG